MKGLALLLPVLVAFQVGVQPALAWAWPVGGPVLRPFILGDDPYAGGQHRGIDIGAPAGADVRAPAAGTVSFAGVVPSGGKTITIRTGDGYAVTLLHLGDYSVARGSTVAEEDVVGSIGPSGDSAEAKPYVYLGIRLADDPNGYVDPLGLLPASAQPVEDSAPPEPAGAPAPSPATGVEGHASSSTTNPAPSPAHSFHQKPAGSSSTSARLHASADRAARGAGARATTDLQRPGVATAALRAPVVSWAHAQTPGEALAQGHDRPAGEAGHARGGGIPWAWALAAAAGAGSLGVAVGLARRRRELGDARAADGPAAVLLQRASASAEDADGLRLREQDDVVLDRDLEWILLAERKALADLDRNDYPAEIVDVADDPRFRRPSGRARRRDSLARSVRPHGFLAFHSRRTLCNTSPRLTVSNHRLGVRERSASFV